MEIVKELRNKKSRDNRELLDSAANEIEKLSHALESLKLTQLCVYRDSLGVPEGKDNLAYIMVPTVWLQKLLASEEGVDIEEFLNTYTADNTEYVLAKARFDGVIVRTIV